MSWPGEEITGGGLHRQPNPFMDAAPPQQPTDWLRAAPPEWPPVPGGGWGPPHKPAPPPSLRPHRSRRGAVLALVCAGAVLSLLLGVAGQRVGGTPEPARSAPTPSTATSREVPSTTPSQLPTPPPRGVPLPVPPVPTPLPPGQGWQLPERDWEPLPSPVAQDAVWTALQAADLLDEQPPMLSSCPAAETVGTETQYQDLVRRQWHCVHLAWLPIFEARGWPIVEPPVSFYPGTGDSSECGYMEAPAFYCSAGAGSVHFGVGHMEMAMEWDLSINEMVNHEYAHHVQSLAGVTAAKLSLDQTDEIERRAELQATCLSASMTRGSGMVNFGPDDWESWQQRLETMTIDGIHGSRESILYWGTRGLYAHVLGDCNTWAVDAERVS